MMVLMEEKSKVTGDIHNHANRQRNRFSFRFHRMSTAVFHGYDDDVPEPAVARGDDMF